MVYVVIIYLYLAILLYLVLGGADFGAGIIEMFTSSKNVGRTRKTLYHAIGPIWEANHMWLIIVIVILFVGFPVIYSELSIYLHIPLVIMLMGIIARGTAFVFRHYDAVRDDMQEFYNSVFVWSSFVTPFFLGVIAASTVSGHIDRTSDNYLDTYVFSWLNPFAIATGLFTTTLCGFLASIYLIGEAGDENDRRRFIRKARQMNLLAVTCGILVFVAAVVDNIPLAKWVFADVLGLAAVTSASISLIFLWQWINSKQVMIPRVLAGFQVTMILLAISYAHFPNFVIMAQDETLSLLDDRAPEGTIRALGWALLIGSVFILPALFYLYYSFKKKDTEAHMEH